MKHVQGDLIASVETGVILQQVNAQGVMRSGFAKAVFEKYPRVREVYCDTIKMNQYHRGLDYVGTIHVVQVLPELFIVNMVSQQFYGKDGVRYTSYDALDKCLAKVAELGVSKMPVHHPMIGAGLGGGNWNVIKTLIEQHLGHDTTLWTLD